VCIFDESHSKVKELKTGALENLALIQFAGEDATSFLHNQLTCDVTALEVNRSTYGSYCTPKGRVLATFLLVRMADGYVMQLPTALRERIQKRLAMYVLRSKVKVADAGPQWIQVGLSGEDAASHLEGAFGAVPHENHQATLTRGGIIIRLPAGRYQALVSSKNAQAALDALTAGTEPLPPAHWEWLDIRAGIPTILPATQEQFVPQMLNMDLIGGLSFSKGCYPGQEIVARMHFLGRLKQRMYLAHFPAAANGAAPPQPGDKLYSADLGNQSSGMIVNASPSPADGYDVLAVIQISSAQAHAVHWKSLEGPVLALAPMPYPIS
jgi:tRNA-modifying protein YgfZ